MDLVPSQSRRKTKTPLCVESNFMQCMTNFAVCISKSQCRTAVAIFLFFPLQTNTFYTRNNNQVRRIPSSGMLRRVGLVRADVSEERITSIIKVTRTGNLGTMLAVKNGVFWDVTPCGSCKNRRFGGT
jgi:hypothetical protein